MKRFFSTVKYPIIVSSRAWNKINMISNTTNNNKFLFTAKSGGCNGFNYKLSQINNDKFMDIINDCKIKPNIIEKNDINILVDPMAEMILLGTTIDYVTEDYEGDIFENKFVFIPNDNLATSCGCGVSFSPRNF